MSDESRVEQISKEEETLDNIPVEDKENINAD
jgi:hypothetical protein